MTLDSAQHVLSQGMVAVGFLCFLALFATNAPYGKFAPAQRSKWHLALPAVPARLAWLIMETPSLYCSLTAFAVYGHKQQHSSGNQLLLGCFVLHYVFRSLLYPLRMSSSASAMPASVMVLSFAFCCFNGTLQGLSLGRWAAPVTATQLLQQPHSVIGLVLFLIGFLLNQHSDALLRNLRHQSLERATRSHSKPVHMIPRGGLFELVSAANYSAETLEWGGFALACWSLPALSFALFTAFNLAPRALAYHRFYQQTFKDYPQSRRAYIPYLL